MEAVTWEDWCQWKQRCALARCDAAVQRRLAGFAKARLCKAARRATGMTNIIEGAERRMPQEPRDAWHLFEVHAVTRQTREGKAYKEWLFCRVERLNGAAQELIESGASMMLRDVARSFLARECLSRRLVSMDAPAPGTKGALTFRDLLPAVGDNPHEAVSELESRELGRSFGGTLFDGYSLRQRLALAARACGIPLTHPALLKLCGCGKTYLFRVTRDLFAALPKQLRERLPDASTVELKQVCTFVIREIENRAISWFSVECERRDSFKEVKGAAK